MTRELLRGLVATPMLRRLGFLGCLLASASADAPTCCACSPPASPPPPAGDQCAGDYGSTVGGKPCCGQARLERDPEPAPEPEPNPDPGPGPGPSLALALA